MRKLVLLVAALALLVTAAATAKTFTVTLTKSGFAPSTITVAQGDTVQFVNSDTVTHQITFKSTAGVTCTSNPLTLAAGQSGSCTFANAGSYSYSDPAAKGNAFKGSVVVTAAAETLSLAAMPHLLVYGATSTLSGVVSTHVSGEKLDVMAQQCGAASATKLMTVATTTNGAFSAVVKPLANTAYTVKGRNASSSPVTISVRPKLHLAKVAAHRYALGVSAASSFAGKYAAFQRYNGTRWVTVKVVQLHAGPTSVAPTVLSSATIRSSIGSKIRVRAIMGRAQTGSCYLAGTSNTTVS